MSRPRFKVFHTDIDIEIIESHRFSGVIFIDSPSQIDAPEWVLRFRKRLVIHPMMDYPIAVILNPPPMERRKEYSDAEILQFIAKSSADRETYKFECGQEAGT